jgi:hypothetical protein
MAWGEMAQRKAAEKIHGEKRHGGKGTLEKHCVVPF